MKNIKAFTLAESLISMAIIGILFTAVGSFISRYFIVGNELYYQMDNNTNNIVVTDSFVPNRFISMPFISEEQITKDNVWNFFITMKEKYPQNIVYDEKKNLYISDTLSHRIIKIQKKEMSIDINSLEDVFDVFVIAGTGIVGFSGNGGRADLARINFPSALIYNKTDTKEVLYFIDFGNNAIRKVDLSVFPNDITNVFLGNVTAETIFFEDHGESFVFSVKNHIIREETF
jgi:prepilin-type N-terminal cleavage/methylation domain-containing protein